MLTRSHDHSSPSPTLNSRNPSPSTSLPTTRCLTLGGTGRQFILISAMCSTLGGHEIFHCLSYRTVCADADAEPFRTVHLNVSSIALQVFNAWWASYHCSSRRPYEQPSYVIKHHFVTRMAGRDICLHPHPPASLNQHAPPLPCLKPSLGPSFVFNTTSCHSVSDVPTSSVPTSASSLSVISFNSPSSLSITFVNRFSTNFNRLPTTSWLPSIAACSSSITACSP
jgi:hypothetical protein